MGGTVSPEAKCELFAWTNDAVYDLFGPFEDGMCVNAGDINNYFGDNVIDGWRMKALDTDYACTVLGYDHLHAVGEDTSSGCEILTVEDNFRETSLTHGANDITSLCIMAHRNSCRLKLYPHTVGVPVAGDPSFFVGPYDLNAINCIWDQFGGTFDNQVSGIKLEGSGDCEVYFYEDDCYAKPMGDIGEGTWSLAELQSRGFKDNKLSSFIVNDKNLPWSDVMKLNAASKCHGVVAPDFVAQAYGVCSNPNRVCDNSIGECCSRNGHCGIGAAWCGPGNTQYPLPDSIVNWDGSRSTWMSTIARHKKLINLNIPGTHDSGAIYGIGDHTIVGGFGKTQMHSISDQLEWGIRYFDIRIGGEEHHGLPIYHGSIYQHLQFFDVYNAMKNFLSSHDQECIILSIQKENDPDYNVYDAVNTFMNGKYSEGYFKNRWIEPREDWYRGWTLSGCTKKIAVISKPDIIDTSPCHQDDYEDLETDEKWDRITSAITSIGGSHCSDKDAWNWMNCYDNEFIGAEDPWDFARYINPRLKNKIESSTQQKYGVMPLDYPFTQGTADEYYTVVNSEYHGVVDSIIASNFPFWIYRAAEYENAPIIDPIPNDNPTGDSNYYFIFETTYSSMMIIGISFSLVLLTIICVICVKCPSLSAKSSHNYTKVNYVDTTDVDV